MPAIGSTVVSRYELRDTLGLSATRVAYRAFDREVEVEVALWCVYPELFPTAPSRSMFVAAAKQSQGLRHRHVLKVFEAGTIDGSAGVASSLYMTQQLATSAELEGRLRTGASNDAPAIARYAASLSGALEAAHGAGLHHGWLTPADVVEVAGQVKLCGTGLFASMDSKAALARFGNDRRYLAPEVVAGRPASAESDWYSLGVLLLELATGSVATSPQIALASLAVKSPKQADALRSALSANPAERPTEAGAFVAGVEDAWQVTAEAAVSPVYLEAPEDEANYDKTISMGQSFIDANVAALIAASKETASEMMVSEVVESPLGGFDEGATIATSSHSPGVYDSEDTAASVAAPPGGFDEGVTSARVSAPTGGFEEGVTSARVVAPTATVTEPAGGFDEGVTVHRASSPPMGFDDGSTVHNQQLPVAGFEDEAKTEDRPPALPGGFDDGQTVDKLATPPPTSDSRRTARKIPAIAVAEDSRATARKLPAIGDGGRATAREVPVVGSSSDRRQTAREVPAPTDGFGDEETSAAAPQIGGFHVDDETMDGSFDSLLGPEDDEAPTVADDTLPPGGFDEGATVVEGAPGPRLLALSMKPKPDPGYTEPKRKVHPGVVAKPVLRPLSSLTEIPEAPQELGILAPPRPATEPTSPRRLWVGLSLFLVAGAATVTIALLLTRGDEVTSKTEVVEVAEVPDAKPPPPPPRQVVVLGPKCKEGTVHLPDSNLCVDAFEAPGVGRQPQSGLTLTEAREACAKREMRLCTGAEWQLACGGAEASDWPYGKRYKPEICNLKGRTIELAGSRPQCRSSFATYDMSGNIAEWVEEGEIRGGSALDRSRGKCSQVRPNKGGQSAFSDVGFRCCADAIASPPPSD